jgi:hypothetical protein
MRAARGKTSGGRAAVAAAAELVEDNVPTKAEEPPSAVRAGKAIDALGIGAMTW